MRLRDRFLGFMSADFVSDRATARIMLVPASLAGGYTFATYGSWLSAIFIMALAYALLWYVFRPIAEWVGESITKAVLFILP
jgi:hypothetical protein